MRTSDMPAAELTVLIHALEKTNVDDEKTRQKLLTQLRAVKEKRLGGLSGARHTT